MMYLPFGLEELNWEWDTINYQVIVAPDGPQQKFVEWLVGWGEQSLRERIHPEDRES
jgi:hypothetical protein